MGEPSACEPQGARLRAALRCDDPRDLSEDLVWKREQGRCICVPRVSGAHGGAWRSRRTNRVTRVDWGKSAVSTPLRWLGPVGC